MAAGLPSLLVIERNLDTGQAGVLSLLPGWVLASQIQSCGHHQVWRLRAFGAEAKRQHNQPPRMMAPAFIVAGMDVVAIDRERAYRLKPECTRC
jgi:hypothetical protein